MTGNTRETRREEREEQREGRMGRNTAANNNSESPSTLPLFLRPRAQILQATSRPIG